MLENKVIGMIRVNWRDISWFQPKDLKDVHPEVIEKLKNSLYKNGVIQALHVWRSAGKTWIIDGHIRHQAMSEMEKEGYKFPQEMPAVELRLKNTQEAARAVLIFNSKYATVSEDSAKKWTTGFGMKSLDLEFNIPGVDFADLDMSAVADTSNLIRRLIVKLPDKDFKMVLQTMEKMIKSKKATEHTGCLKVMLKSYEKSKS